MENSRKRKKASTILNTHDGFTIKSDANYNAPRPTSDNVLQDIQKALKSAAQTYEHVEVLLCCLRAYDSSVLFGRNQNPSNTPQMEEQRLRQRLGHFNWHTTSVTMRPEHEFPRRFSKHVEELVGNLGKKDFLVVYYTDFGYVFDDNYGQDKDYVRTNSGYILNFARILRSASRKSSADVLGLWDSLGCDTHSCQKRHEAALSKVFLVPSIAKHTDTVHRSVGLYNFTRLQHILLRLAWVLRQSHGLKHLEFKGLHEQYAQRIELQLTPVSDRKERGFIALDYTKLSTIAQPTTSRIEITILAQPNAWEAALDWFANHAGDDEVRPRRQYHYDAVTFGKSAIEQPFRMFMPIQLFTHFPRSKSYLGWSFVYGEDSDRDLSEEDDLDGPPPDEAGPEDDKIFEKDSWEVSQGWSGIGHMLSEVFDDKAWLRNGMEEDEGTRTPSPSAASEMEEDEEMSSTSGSTYVPSSSNSVSSESTVRGGSRRR